MSVAAGAGVLSAAVIAAITIPAINHSSHPYPTSQTPTAQSAPSSTQAGQPAPKYVRVYDVGIDEGAAGPTVDRLREAGWTITGTGNITTLEVTETTVYFGRHNAGEQEKAEAVGEALGAPVLPRTLDLESQPAGVIVLVPG